MSILVVMEQRAVRARRPGAACRGRRWRPASSSRSELQQPVSAAVLGQGIEGLAAELAARSSTMSMPSSTTY